MKLGTVGDKLAHVFVPLLLLAAVFVLLYSLANWFLIASGLVALDQDLANVWLPIALSAVLVAALIAARLHILKLEKNAPLYFQIAATAVLAVPACFAQSYVTTASGTLTSVKSADMIASAARTRYYTAATICIDRQKSLVRHQNEIYGRRNESLEFKIYVLIPVCDTASRPVWIGLIYTDRMSNSATASAKEAEYRDFLRTSQMAFESFDPANIRYLELLGQTADRRSYEKALPRNGAASSPIILVPHLEAFGERRGPTLLWTFYSFGIAAAVFLVMLLIPPLDSERLAEARKPPSERLSGEVSIWRTFLVPQRDAYGLPVLIDINLAVYLAMVFSGLGVISFQVDDLMAWGASYGPAIHGLGVFRLISSQFVHGGLMHIGSNLYGLMFAGLFLSPVIRKAGLVASYLLCGLGGAIASVMAHPATISVGASGAIMGLWGIVLVLALLGDKRVVAGRWAMVANGVTFAGLTLAQGIANPGIDNAAHIGGIVTGVAIGGLIFLFSWGEKLQARSAAE